MITVDGKISYVFAIVTDSGIDPQMLATLEEGGVARFPDAPTERGLKHVRGLTALSRQGNRCVVLIVIQMKGVHRFEPNWETHPAFGEALIEAREAGVEVLAVDCMVRPGIVEIDGFVPVDLSRPGTVR